MRAARLRSFRDISENALSVEGSFRDLVRFRERNWNHGGKCEWEKETLCHKERKNPPS